MYYRIKFRAAPKEFVFEAIRHFILIEDVVSTIRENFKIHQDELYVYSEEGIKLQPKDHVENGRTYVVKRIPPGRAKITRHRKFR